MKDLWRAALAALQRRGDEESMDCVRATDDPHEFARLVRKWEGPIRRLCTRLTGDAARGEELKQEAFLRLFQSRRDYRPSGKFSTFLWRIALNLCHDEFRRQERRRQFLTEPRDHRAYPDQEAGEGVSEWPGPDAVAIQAEEGELVRQSVLQLPEIYRTVIVMRHYEGFIRK